MSSPKALSLLVVDLGEEAGRRLDRWRAELIRLDASAPVMHESSFLGIELRGAAVVATLAQVERLLREFLVGLAAEVEASRTEVRRLVPSLRALVGHSKFESLSSSSRGDVVWGQRVHVTAYDADTAYASLPPRMGKGPQPPLDGKTITDAHILRMWSVLSVRVDPFPKASCATSLRRLASLRNDIAHGNFPINEVMRSPGASAADLAMQIDDIILLILHVATELSTYVKEKHYRI